MSREFATDLIDYIYSSPTSFHAVKTSKELLENNGFEELKLNKKWELKVGGKYFVTKNSSSIVSFCTGLSKRASLDSLSIILSRFEIKNLIAIIFIHW